MDAIGFANTAVFTSFQLSAISFQLLVHGLYLRPRQIADRQVVQQDELKVLS
jgi:hypothetical protein